MKQLLILTVLGLAGLPAFAANGSGSFEIPAGAMTDLPELGLHWESFELPAPARAALASGRRGDVVELSAFPVAPGVRRDVRFEAFEVYAPGAKIWEIRDGERREIPRDGSARYLGRSADGATRVGLSLAGEELYAFALSPEGAYRLTGPKADGTFAVEDATPPGGLLYEGCGTEHMAIPDSVLDAMEALRPSGLPASLQGTEQEVQGAPASRQAVVAVDTDTELLSEKFGNNSTTALTYITSLFVVLNVMYERDLDLFLLQGDTTIRTGSDPFNNTDTPASLAQLQEFGTWWSTNQGGVDRAFAMLLSGKSSTSNSGSGIAWVDGYCETQSTGGGYSINQIFTGNFPVDLDARLVGHELGHNAGSPHTHCYSPPVDQCYRAESGCYSGSVSCPGGSNGTVMSYCNFSPPNGAGCGQNNLEFHPTVQTLIEGFIAAHQPSCVTSFNGLFSDGFESGNTSAWSATDP